MVGETSRDAGWDAGDGEPHFWENDEMWEGGARAVVVKGERLTWLVDSVGLKNWVQV